MSQADERLTDLAPTADDERRDLPERRERARLAVIIEDDEPLRELAAALLEETDLAVVECSTAEEALDVMRRRGGDVAMVFADIRLPGEMDGVEFARAAAVMWPRTKLVLTSGGSVDRLKALPAGATYMPKPWRALDVLVAAELAQRSGRPAVM
jgi:DNA-binding response OmpR family regulator